MDVVVLDQIEKIAGAGNYLAGRRPLFLAGPPLQDLPIKNSLESVVPVELHPLDPYIESLHIRQHMDLSLIHISLANAGFKTCFI